MSKILLLNIILFSIFALTTIFEMIFKKRFIKYGITVYKNNYTLKNNYFKDNIGKRIKKDDVYIDVINEHFSIFEEVWLGRKFVDLYGYIEIENDKIITVYKIQSSLIFILIILFLNYIFNESFRNSFIVILITLLILAGTSIFFNKLKISSIKFDIESFINNGK